MVLSPNGIASRTSSGSSSEAKTSLLMAIAFPTWLAANLLGEHEARASVRSRAARAMPSAAGADRVRARAGRAHGGGESRLGVSGSRFMRPSLGPALGERVP